MQTFACLCHAARKEKKAAQQSDLAHRFASKTPRQNRVEYFSLVILVIQCNLNFMLAYKSWQGKTKSNNLILLIHKIAAKNANNQNFSKSFSKLFIPIATPRNIAHAKKLPRVEQRGHKRNTNHYQMDYTAAKFPNNFCCRVAGETNSTLSCFFLQMIFIIILLKYGNCMILNKTSFNIF